MTYDLIVIGTGPGGYVCAIRAAQLGLKTRSLRSDLSCSNICHNRQTGLSPVARSTFSSKIKYAFGY